MAKQNLPRIDEQQQSAPQLPEPPKAQRSVELPEFSGYVPRRVDVKLPIKHRNILHKKLRMLQDAGARLADGTEVSDRTKAVLWILENEVQV